ncbi:universal stress protein [Companilactobacillus alimentarius]|nr:universal stress protein [Companilactobacillus alimentarius]KRK74755.1 UspA family nucleotide-binding protein [Companilactobacillus alimentarius DSM 20249]MDT6951332.1 universal stress protein [Companilactobacillus alimentarius]
MMFRRILVAIDGSEVSYRALDTAIELAKKFESKLYLIGVVNTINLPTNVGVSYVPGLIEDLKIGTKNDLNKGKDLVKNAGLLCNVKLLEGEPRVELTNYSQNNNIDLVVMGKTGKNSLTRALVGSVTRYVSEHAGSVLIVE